MLVATLGLTSSAVTGRTDHFSSLTLISSLTQINNQSQAASRQLFSLNIFTSHQVRPPVFSLDKADAPVCNPVAGELAAVWSQVHPSSHNSILRAPDQRAPTGGPLPGLGQETGQRASSLSQAGTHWAGERGVRQEICRVPVARQSFKHPTRRYQSKYRNYIHNY